MKEYGNYPMRVSNNIYDLDWSYEENYRALRRKSEQNARVKTFIKFRKPSLIFGKWVRSPVGVSAGPLVNSRKVSIAAEKGFDILTYKTVATKNRSPNDQYCSYAPEVVMQPNKKLQSLNNKKNQPSKALSHSLSIYSLHPLSIYNLHSIDFGTNFNLTNNLGLPSQDFVDWCVDVKRAKESLPKGKLLILSIWGETKDDFLNLIIGETHGSLADVVELNLSCPNLDCSDSKFSFIDQNTGVVKSIRGIDRVYNRKVKYICDVVDYLHKDHLFKYDFVNHGPYITIKIPYLPYKYLEKLVKRVGHKVHGISAINSIKGLEFSHNKDSITTKQEISISGYNTKELGLEVTNNLYDLRERYKKHYKIISSGGVLKPEHVDEYLNAGADLVMAATGAIVNQDLAKQWKEQDSEAEET